VVTVIRIDLTADDAIVTADCSLWEKEWNVLGSA